MMRLRQAIFVTIILAAGSATAAEFDDWSIPVRTTWGYSSDAGETMQGVVEAEPTIALRFTPRARMVLSARLRVDTEDYLEPDEPNRDTYSSMSQPVLLGNSGTAEVRDAFLEIELENGVARIGKQQIVWGRLDGLKVLDVLNPQSYREFILDDLDRSRIGLWSVYFDKSFGNWRTELALIPDTTGHEIPVEGAWFQLTAPRFRYGSPVGQPTPDLVTDRGAHGFSDGAIGLRLSRQVGALDMSAVAYSGLDFEPLGRLTMTENAPSLERFYERRTLYGLNAETSVGPLALRTEVSFQPERTFNTRSLDGLGTVALDQSRIAVAADISGPLDIFINVQYVVDRISNAPSTLVRPNRDRIVTAFLRRSFANESVAFELRWYKSLEADDHLLSLSLEYEIGDNTRLRLDSELFRGARDGIFGQFTDKDRLLVGIEHTF